MLIQCGIPTAVKLGTSIIPTIFSKIAKLLFKMHWCQFEAVLAI